MWERVLKDWQFKVNQVYGFEKYLRKLQTSTCFEMVYRVTDLFHVNETPKRGTKGRQDCCKDLTKGGVCKRFTFNIINRNKSYRRKFILCRNLVRNIV